MNLEMVESTSAEAMIVPEILANGNLVAECRTTVDVLHALDDGNHLEHCYFVLWNKGEHQTSFLQLLKEYANVATLTPECI